VTAAASKHVLVAQDATFAGGAYGFASIVYWSSSQGLAGTAWAQFLDFGNQVYAIKNTTVRIRPVRAF